MRYDIKLVSQNFVEVIDYKAGESFFLKDCDDTFRKYKQMVQESPETADIWLGGFLQGLDYCDIWLKSIFHLFKEYI